MARIIWPIREIIFTTRDRNKVWKECFYAINRVPGSWHKVYEIQHARAIRNWMYYEVVHSIKVFEKIFKVQFEVKHTTRNRTLIVYVRG